MPRRFRPHEVRIIQQMPENEDGVSEEKIITIQHLKADPSYGIQQSKRGITTDDKIMVYMELNDYMAVDEFGCSISYGEDFTIKVDDTLKFRDDEYLITGVNEIFLDSIKPIRVEITAK